MRGLLREVARGKSLLRAYLNARVCPSIDLRGTVLDLGSGAQPSYWCCLDRRRVGQVVSLDIERASRPSVVASLETGLPFRSGTADVVLMFNVLEHVFHHQELMGEVHRILKPGGRAHVYVPFMHKVHAHPYDFFRYTGESLRRIGEKAGFRGVEVEPYGGLFVALYENLKVFVRPRALRWLVAASLLSADGVFGRLRRDINSTYVIGYHALLTR